MARRWRGVLVTEGVQTGDGRVIAPGALSFAPLPLPLAWIRDGDQHINLTEVAPQVGIIETITQDGADWVGEGTIDDEQPDGAELVRRMDAGQASNGNRQLVSIDPDDWAVDIMLMDTDDEDGVVILAAAGTGMPPRHTIAAAAGEPDPGPDGGPVIYSDSSDAVLERYTRMRIRGATCCAVSAFTEAGIELVDDQPAADDQNPDAVAAAGGLQLPPPATLYTPPPADVFSIPEPDLGDTGMVEVYGMPVDELLIEQPDGGFGVPQTIVTRPDGTRVVFGHAALWEQCHVGYPGECVTAPPSNAAYAHFHVGEVVCADGSHVATGTLTMATDHAAAHLLAPEARDHYANTGLGWADVRATNGRFGAWVCGIVRSDVTMAQEHILRATSLSGDWRRIGVDLEFIAALSVNVPGFPIARELVAAAGLLALPMASLAASAYVADGVQMSLVASGIVQRCPECQRAAMANRGRPAIDQDGIGEALTILRRLDARTQHLTGNAVEHALGQIRRPTRPDNPDGSHAGGTVLPPRHGG